MKPISQRIRQARRAAGLSQSELARDLGVSRSAVAQWEHRDGSNPSSSNLAALATKLGCAYEWLATGRGDRAPREPDAERSAEAAIVLEHFAKDDAEEHLLSSFRNLDQVDRRAVAALVDVLSSRNARRRPAQGRK